MVYGYYHYKSDQKNVLRRLKILETELERWMEHCPNLKVF